ncbi:MAG TPA: SRPBCC family protein [Acidimicrobiales bacterium]
MNEMLTTADGRSVLRIERRLAHPTAKVWRAVTDPAHLARWFPAPVAFDGDLAVGVKVGFDMGDGLAWDGVVTHCDPPRTVAFTWGDDHLRLDLSPVGPSCRLVLVHTFDDRAGAASFAAGWDRCLDALGRGLDGRPAEIEPPSAELHERFVRQFDLTAATVVDGPSGWAVRTERQLTRPAATAWAVLTGAAGDAAGPTAADAREAALAAGDPVPPRAVAAGLRPGRVSAVEAPILLAYQWCEGDREAGDVRWELGHEGTGHGARLVVVQTGPPELAGARAAALAAWPAAVDALAADLLASRP